MAALCRSIAVQKLRRVVFHWGAAEAETPRNSTLSLRTFLPAAVSVTGHRHAPHRARRAFWRHHQPAISGLRTPGKITRCSRLHGTTPLPRRRGARHQQTIAPGYGVHIAPSGWPVVGQTWRDLVPRIGGSSRYMSPARNPSTPRFSKPVHHVIIKPLHPLQRNTRAPIQHPYINKTPVHQIWEKDPYTLLRKPVHPP